MTVVSLFSGAGGLDLGLIQAGHRVVWANDLYADAVRTYRRNVGDHVVCADITKVDSADIPDCDMVIGGFPCQGFSVANTKRRVSDSRNVLYRELLRVIRDKRPVFFLAENVKGLLHFDSGRVFSRILEEMAEPDGLWRGDSAGHRHPGLDQSREPAMAVRELSGILGLEKTKEHHKEKK